MKPNRNIQTNYPDGDKIFFTSDTHFNHNNIISFAQRPFHNVEEMDDMLIKNWNDKVPTDGLVFHLGDFCFGRGNCKRYLNRLNGRVILVIGNHDFNNMSAGDLDLFAYHSQQMFISIEKRKIFLNHFPFLCYTGVYRQPEDMIWQLFGHVHSHTSSDINSGIGGNGKDIPRLNMLFPCQYDVGVDNNGFAPISWNELKEKIESNIYKNNEPQV